MIGMQYSFALPADYDMTIIDRRIHDKGKLLDGFPHLRFKAYLSARKLDDGFDSADNLYAPFYLWNDAEGIGNFLGGPGFASLARDYGWPKVRTWVVWHADIREGLSDARYATREIVTIPAHTDLSALRIERENIARAAVRDDALAAVVAFDPTEWQFIFFRLLRRLPTEFQREQQVYRVGYIATG